MHHSAAGSGQPYLVPARKRAAFGPSLFSVMLGAVFCINSVRFSGVTSLLRVSVISGCLILSDAFLHQLK